MSRKSSENRDQSKDQIGGVTTPDRFEILKEEVEKAPQSLETNRNLANYLMESSREDEAEQYLEVMLKLDPGCAEAHNALGMICSNRDQVESAERHFMKALMFDFGLTEAHFNLASFYYGQGKYKEALSYYKEVITADPNDYRTYCFMGECALRCNMESEAEAFFLEAVIPLPLTERQIFRKLGFEKGGQGVEPRSERW